MQRTRFRSAGTDGPNSNHAQPSTRRVHSGSPARAQPGAGEPLFSDPDDPLETFKVRIAALDGLDDVEAMRSLLIDAAPPEKA